MMTKERLISTAELCLSHKIKLSLIDSLHEFGLIEIITIQQERFINTEELHKLEKILLFNKELGINLEGIEVIIRLLERVNQIQSELNTLRNRLAIYENL